MLARPRHHRERELRVSSRKEEEQGGKEEGRRRTRRKEGRKKKIGDFLHVPRLSLDLSCFLFII